MRRAHGFPLRFSEPQLLLLRLAAMERLYEDPGAVDVQTLLSVLPTQLKPTVAGGRASALVRLSAPQVATMVSLLDRCIVFGSMGIAHTAITAALSRRRQHLLGISSVDLLGSVAREP